LTSPRRAAAPALALAVLLVAGGCAGSAAKRQEEARARAEAAEREARIDNAIRAGRALLDADRAAEAEASFQQAVELDGATLRTRMWVLRAWMDQGQSNDTLKELDALAAGGAGGPDMDYLYGMAFARRAQGQLALGVSDSSILLNFQDALGRLADVVDVDPERYRDAHLLLARAAWECQDFDIAARAAERAIAYYPDQPASHLMLGRVAFARFQLAQNDEPDPAKWSDEARATWERAVSSYRRAAELCRDPANDRAQRFALTEISTQLGHALCYGRRLDEAADAYATALSWSPEGADFPGLRQWLMPFDGGKEKPFNRALTLAAQRFAEHYEPGDPRDAALLWWKGWSDYTLQQRDEAEAAFTAVLRKAPEYSNAWFYLALVRFNGKDYPGALEALGSGWEADPAAIVAEVDVDSANTVAKFETLTSWCVQQERFADAALVAEICAEALVTEPRHWNNLGLFLRDEAVRLVRENVADDPTVIEDLLERSLTAYRRAVELKPDDPQILNDTAVVLHYYLGRSFDLTEALELYERASALARAALERTDLSPGERDRYQAALQDAAENLGKLEQKLTTGVDPDAVKPD